MKKTLLTLISVAIALTSQAQTFTGLETGWHHNWARPAGDCAASSGNIGNMDNNSYVNTNFLLPPTFDAMEGAFKVTSSSTIITGSMAGWNGFLYNDGVNCSYIRNIGGVDLSAPSHGRLAIVAKASTNGAVLRVYLGTTGTSGWSPASSTYNTGAGSSIIAEFTLTDSYLIYTIDYEVVDATTWTAWAGRTTVNQWGFDPRTASTDYFIQGVYIGTDVPLATLGVTTTDNNAIGIYPNPASTEVNIDFNGMEQNGAIAKLINANGLVVFEGAIGSTFSVAGYNKGIYMLQVTSGNKVANKKLVIQ